MICVEFWVSNSYLSKCSHSNYPKMIDFMYNIIQNFGCKCKIIFHNNLTVALLSSPSFSGWNVVLIYKERYVRGKPLLTDIIMVNSVYCILNYLRNRNKTEYLFVLFT